MRTPTSDGILDTREYRAIAAAYEGRTTQRSGVSLMRHIDDGLAILARISASTAAMRAYCLHPLLQADEDLVLRAPQITTLSDDPYVILLAIEYRNVANAALSTRELRSAADIALSPLSEVNDMLIADKVQNRRDFERYHRATHARSAELDLYFRRWIERLGVTEQRYLELVA